MIALSVNDLIHGLSPTCVIRGSVLTLGGGLVSIFLNGGIHSVCGCSVRVTCSHLSCWVEENLKHWPMGVIHSSLNFYSDTSSPLNQLLQQPVRCPCFTAEEPHFQGQFSGR